MQTCENRREKYRNSDGARLLSLFITFFHIDDITYSKICNIRLLYLIEEWYVYSRRELNIIVASYERRR